MAPTKGERHAEEVPKLPVDEDRKCEDGERGDKKLAGEETKTGAAWRRVSKGETGKELHTPRVVHSQP